jgi:glycine C-acetyltransferase
MRLSERRQGFVDLIQAARSEGFYPYFQRVSWSGGPEVEVDGRRLVMLSSNDYLGLSHDPRVAEAVAHGARRWGSATGGSRFLCGNLAIHEELENRLAAFVGKRKALLHTTGFGANLGVIGCLLEPGDVLLCDHENHASVFAGCRSSPARLATYPHLDARSARARLCSSREKFPNSVVCVVSDGVFSMSGDVADLPALVALKREHERVVLYVDDAHGLGVLGERGRGTAEHFGASDDVDFVMGTFSKAFASIGGFVASDDEETMLYLKHQSRTLIFSAALPAGNVGAVLASLDIVEREPERVARLRQIAQRAREGYREAGLYVRDSPTPIIPVYIGADEVACRFARDLFEHGVFALPALYPAVPRGQAVIRTAYMSTHEDRHVAQAVDVLAKLAAKYRVRRADMTGSEPFLSDAGAPRADRCSRV